MAGNLQLLQTCSGAGLQPREGRVDGKLLYYFRIPLHQVHLLVLDQGERI